jgi:hypothetical protein
MGAIVQFRRRTPSIRSSTVSTDITRSSEEMTSLRILLWTFGGAAVAMCATVVITLSRSWTEMLWISSFVLVFALLKIGLANLLFLVMIRYDKDRRTVAGAQSAPVSYRRPRPSLHKSARLVGALRVAGSVKKPARPSAP